jgi:predicted alpha-1,2-mannosidase
MGTGVGGAAVGEINASPAADTPLGMMQWGPDTSPVRAPGGGYLDGQHALSGFSLTHLSGPGCPALGDVPILPVVGNGAASPEATTAAFSTHAQRATPGRYSVTLTKPAIAVDLAVTTRTGLARFTFPSTPEANIVLKVADSAAGAVDAHTTVTGDREVSGSVTSGHFCDTPGTYTLYFDARFDRPFGRVATWKDATMTAGGHTVAGPHSGATVSFDATRDHAVTMKVGISFTSAANARANLAAENKGWSVPAVAAAARTQWNGVLGRIAVTGGTSVEQRTFYSSLYHSLLHPNVFSDVNGQYAGFDGQVHEGNGRTQYANFSGWDI